MWVNGGEIEDTVSLSNFGEISSSLAVVVLISVMYLFTWSETIGVRYIEMSGGFDKYCLYEFISIALTFPELPKL